MLAVKSEMPPGSELSDIEQEIEPSAGGENLNIGDRDTQIIDTPVDNNMPGGLLVSVHKSYFYSTFLSFLNSPILLLLRLLSLTGYSWLQRSKRNLWTRQFQKR